MEQSFSLVSAHPNDHQSPMNSGRLTFAENPAGAGVLLRVFCVFAHVTAHGSPAGKAGQGAEVGSEA